MQHKGVICQQTGCVKRYGMPIEESALFEFKKFNAYSIGQLAVLNHRLASSDAAGLGKVAATWLLAGRNFLARRPSTVSGS